MKKIFLGVIIVLLLFIFALPAKGNDSIVITMKVGRANATVNGENVPLDVPIIIDKESNRTLVPLRFIAEAFGAEVNWIAKNKEIDIALNGETIVLFVGKKTAFIDKAKLTLDTAPIILFSRTLVPIRFIAEAFGADVQWNAKNKEIVITLDKNNYIPQTKQYAKADPNAVTLIAKKVPVSSNDLKNITFYIIKVNLTAENISFAPFISDNGMHTRESYSSFIARVKPIAMINAGTFDLETNTLTGDVVRNGIPLYIAQWGYTETMGVTRDNVPFFADGVTNYSIMLDNTKINISHTNREDGILFTNSYKKQISVAPDKELLVIEDNHPVITKTNCTFYPATLKDDQYALLLPKPSIKKIPQNVKIKIEINGKDFSGASFVKCGPLLLKNGKAYLDYLKYSNLNRTLKRGARTLLGSDDKGNIYFIFTPDPVRLSYGTLSLALERLHMFKDVISLDGGGSCLFYYKGHYIARPGRKIMSVIAIPSEVEK